MKFSAVLVIVSLTSCVRANLGGNDYLPPPQYSTQGVVGLPNVGGELTAYNNNFGGIGYDDAFGRLGYNNAYNFGYNQQLGNLVAARYNGFNPAFNYAGIAPYVGGVAPYVNGVASTYGVAPTFGAVAPNFAAASVAPNFAVAPTSYADAIAGIDTTYGSNGGYVYERKTKK